MPENGVSKELSQARGNNTVKKLPPIPKGFKVQRRAGLTRPPSTASVQRIYVSPKSPFRMITSRVRKQLDKFLRQASASNKAFTNRLAGSKNATLDDRVRALQRHATQRPSGSGEYADAGEVLVCGTGRAIQVVLQVASFFQKQNDCVVQLRTGSIGAIDDVVANEGEEKEEEEEEDPWASGADQRVRMMSSLEASIKLK
ncbi:Rpp20 subunit of nuclear RNase MRP and P-domain-containing protein [Xylariomycetidae sp. FL0641]|nr:Rpp20 subunit of nuclear RNase MRP and P-domain-containing protein [Xylariomycetidae sp. FL0641]